MDSNVITKEINTTEEAKPEVRELEEVIVDQVIVEEVPTSKQDKGILDVLADFLTVSAMVVTHDNDMSLLREDSTRDINIINGEYYITAEFSIHKVFYIANSPFVKQSSKNGSSDGISDGNVTKVDETELLSFTLWYDAEDDFIPNSELLYKTVRGKWTFSFDQEFDRNVHEKIEGFKINPESTKSLGVIGLLDFTGIVRTFFEDIPECKKSDECKHGDFEQLVVNMLNISLLRKEQFRGVLSIKENNDNGAENYHGTATMFPLRPLL